MEIKCPKCSGELELPESAIGRKVQCPFCDEKFIGSSSLALTQAEPQPSPQKMLSRYVPPDGARHDQPTSEVQVMDDNPFLVTTGFARSKLRCIHGHEFTAVYRKFLNVTDDWKLRKAVLDGSYFDFTCPRCGDSGRFPFRVVVYDVMHRYYLRSFDDMKTLMAAHRNHSTMAGTELGFPDEFLPHVRQRLVLGPEGLVEKMRIFGAGLDDYAVEGVKAWILNQQETGVVNHLLFREIANEGDLRFEISFEDGRCGYCEAKRSKYNEFALLLGIDGGFAEGVFRYVDRTLMLGEKNELKSWRAKQPAPEPPIPPKPIPAPPPQPTTVPSPRSMPNPQRRSNSSVSSQQPTPSAERRSSSVSHKEQGSSTMKLKTTDGETYNVVKVGPVQAYRITMGLDDRIPVRAGEYAERGEVLLYQEGAMDADRYEREYNAAIAQIRKDGGQEVPLFVILLHNRMACFGAKYHLERGGTEMMIEDVWDLETPYTINAQGLLEESGFDDDDDDDGIIPIPPPPKNASDELYLTLAYAPYDAIKRGEKKEEYRDYTPNWVKKILSHEIRTVRFQRGYGGPGHAAPEQMVWTVSGIDLVDSETGKRGDPFDPPEGLHPDVIAIHLGRRVK